jgi:hypothetical protein
MSMASPIKFRSDLEAAKGVSPHDRLLDRLYELLGEVVLLPIPLGEKGPKEPGWQARTFAESQKHRDELLEVIKRGGNLGVLLGPKSNRLLALDLDSDQLVDTWLVRHPWLANTMRSEGKRGCQFWLRLANDCDYPNGKAIYKLIEGNEAIGEIRLGGCGGAQSVLFGLHPDGMRYEIVVKKPPLVISLADLDELAPGLLFGEEPKEPAPTPTTNNGVPKGIDVTERIRLYMAKVPPSIEGQNGDDQLFRAASILVNGWGLSPDEAFPFLAEYNQRAEPPWPEQRLRYKLKEAFEKPGDKPRGHLRDSDKRPPGDPPLSRRIKEEQVQTRQDESSDNDAEPIDLEAETAERLKRYTTDPEPFPPPMRPEAFHGVVGQIATLMAQHCESSPEVLLLHGLVIVGNIIGRSAYVYGGGPQLYPNEFAVFVGETARGRKGTAYSMWEQLAQLVNRDWFEGCLSGQTQTGEGIVHRVRDERYGVAPGKKKKGEPLEEVLLDAGISDKRLLILEEEFSHALKMAQRSGNTLSETLRKAWDSPRSLRTDNKNSPLKANDPHVSLIGHTTRDELLGTLKMVDLNNGMANRVLWCAARRTGDMPNAEFLDWKHQPAIIEQLKEIFSQRFPNTAEPDFFSRTNEAKNYWDQLYRKLNAEKQSSTIDAVLARDTSHILKIALIFAITDKALNIETGHLKAALAVIDFCRDSARWIFGQATGNKLANNILLALRRSPAGLTRTNIHEDVCYRTTPKSQLDAALAELAKNKLAKMSLEDAKKGPRVERWFVTT